MAKRFIDTGFLDQKWIRKLTPERKIFLIYLMLKCDNGGIIELDIEDASFWIGKKIENLDFLPEGYLIPLNDSSKYFMPKFIEWQYKDLSSQKFIVVQARQILEKHNLINDDFTLNLDKSYVNVTKQLHEFHVRGIGIGKGKGKGKSEELLRKREDAFKLDVSIFSGNYPQEMLQKFVNYWTEKNKSKTKMRFELEKTFEISKRLATWASRDKDIINSGKKVLATLTYDEILAASKDDPGIWDKYDAVKRDGEKKAIFVPKK